MSLTVTSRASSTIIEDQHQNHFYGFNSEKRKALLATCDEFLLAINITFGSNLLNVQIHKIGFLRA